MNRKKVINCLIVLMVNGVVLTGCSSTKSELKKLLRSGSQIELTLGGTAESDESIAKLTDWVALASLTDQEAFRKVMDDELYIFNFANSGKNGVMYVNPDTKEWELNNTIENVFKNKAFKEYWEDSEIQSAIQDAVKEAYSDVDDLSSAELKLVALDSYFNLYSEEEDGGNYNGDSTVTRAEFMTALARASQQADDEATADEELTKQLGKDDSVIYAGYVVDDSYLDLESKSLDETTYNGTITRAEVIYMLVKEYYGDELSKIGTEEDCYSDCKNAGDMAEKAETTGKDYYRTANLEYMIENPSKGLDEELYKAMEVAYKHGIIDTEEESNWSNAATKLDTLSMLINVYNDLGTTCNCTMGRNTADTFAKEDSTERLSYEQFLSETGLSDGEEAQDYYNLIYIGNIEDGVDAGEAFDIAVEAIKADEEAANSVSNVATTDESNTSSNTDNVSQETMDSGQGTTNEETVAYSHPYASQELVDYYMGLGLGMVRYSPVENTYRGDATYEELKNWFISVYQTKMSIGTNYFGYELSGRELDYETFTQILRYAAADARVYMPVEITESYHVINSEYAGVITDIDTSVIDMSKPVTISVAVNVLGN